MPPKPLFSTNHAGGQVTAAYLQPLLDLVLERGITLSELALAAGLPDHTLTPLPDSVTAPDYVRLMDAGAMLTRDPHFGLQVGERFKLGTYSVYGLILLSCRNFGQVIEQTIRYEGLAHDLGTSTLQTQDHTAHYLWESKFPNASRHLAESVFAGIRVFSHWLAGRTLPTPTVCFTHAAPDDCSAHTRLFGEEVIFDAPVNRASFDAGLLSLPVANADVGLYPVLQQHAEQLLKEKLRSQTEHEIVGRVRAAISINLTRDRARVVTIAQDLHLSQRTLQRKLQDAGWSFQKLLDQTRSEWAINYLKQPHLGLADIAFLLGYQEQSAFNHAFKEWTGRSPGTFREQEFKRNT
jgi:AraC-like DNA-binding protein